MLARLHEPRFVDLAPAEVYATLLDEGAYLCSEAGGRAPESSVKSFRLICFRPVV